MNRGRIERFRPCSVSARCLDEGFVGIRLAWPGCVAGRFLDGGMERCELEGGARLRGKVGEGSKSKRGSSIITFLQYVRS